MSNAKDASKLVNQARKQARKDLGLSGGASQQEQLRRVRKALALTNEGLAQALGVKPATLLAYLAPDTAAKHRQLPAESRLVLRRLLAAKRKG